MKKTATALLMARAVMPAWADRAKVKDPKQETAFFEPVPLVVKGPVPQVGSIRNDSRGAESLETLEEFDCGRTRIRILQTVTRRGAMGRGVILAVQIPVEA